ncbi:MAG TPA: GrpB family protein [Caulobacteraceae bacterium]|nr:GrpB family protein [Caulobacteraceae bacterium]
MTSKPETDEEMATIRVSGTVTPSNAPIHLADYDPTWPLIYDLEAAKIRAGLGDGAIVLEHIGSTSIPGLCAKPLIDILLAVTDSADEDSYVPALTAQGYRLHLREPDWEQHRVMKGDFPPGNLHVFTTGSVEIARMLAFRDRCRADPDERRLYQTTKRELAARTWRHVQHYANAKSEVVEAIIARALAERNRNSI